MHQECPEISREMIRQVLQKLAEEGLIELCCRGMATI